MGWSERNVVVDVTSTIDDDDDSETIYIYMCNVQCEEDNRERDRQRLRQLCQCNHIRLYPMRTVYIYRTVDYDGCFYYYTTGIYHHIYGV